MKPEELVCRAETILFRLSGSFVRVCVFGGGGGGVIAAATPTTPEQTGRVGRVISSVRKRTDGSSVGWGSRGG